MRERTAQHTWLPERDWQRWGALVAAFTLPLLAILYASQYLDFTQGWLALDWRWYYSNARLPIDSSLPTFVAAPWAIPFLIPFAALPFRLSWAVMLYFTVLMLLVSVPRHSSMARTRLTMMLLVFTFPALRNFADLNLEAFVILGVLLTLLAVRQRKAVLLGVAIVLAATKPQEVFLLVLVLGVHLLRHDRQVLRVVTVIAGSIFAIMMLRFGADWIAHVSDNHHGVSLHGVGSTFDWPLWLPYLLQITVIAVTLAVALRGSPQLTRLKAGALIAGSLIAAPYANALSIVTLLAIGVAALAVEKPLVGGALFALYYAPYLQLAGVEFFQSVSVSAAYFLGANSVVWLVLLVYVERERRPRLTAPPETP